MLFVVLAVKVASEENTVKIPISWDFDPAGNLKYDDVIMSDSDASPAALAPKTNRGELTRQKILDAAEREIGQKGFAEASVSAITAEAAVAQGTFYLYFRNKEEVLRELVLRMGRRLRRHLTLAIADANSRLEAERAGLLAFLEFARANPNLYRVVEESQFVDPSVYHRYYDDFARNYRAALIAAEGTGEIRPGNAEIRAWALMGLAVMLGHRYGIWDTSVPLKPIADAAFDMIAVGLERRDDA